MISALLLAALGAPPVVALEDDGPAWAELRVALPGGAAADPRGKSGLAHVAALILERRLSPLGARAHLGRRGIAVSLGAPSAQVEKAATEIIETIAKEPAAAEVEAAVRVAVERRRRFADDDRALAEMELARALGVPHHPLGTLEELARISRDDVLSHQRRHWAGDQLLLVISGRFAPDAPKRASEMLQKLDRPAAKGEPPPPEGKGPRGGLRVLLVDKPQRTRAQIAIGREIGKVDATKIAASAALGGSMSGRLTKAMQRPPAAGTYAFSTIEENRLIVSTSVPAGDTAAAIARLLEALREVAKKGLEPNEMMLGRRSAAAAIELSQRDAGARADAAVRAHFSGEGMDGGRLLELGDDAIKRASQAMAKANGLAIVVVASATAELQAALIAIPGVKEVQVARYDLR